MLSRPQQLKISVAEYMELNRKSEQRYEYIDGYAYMLAGGNLAHARIASHLVREIGRHLLDGPCDVYSSDAQVLLAEERIVFPDVTVSCDEQDRSEGALFIRNPRLVIEVLSPGTEAYDRSDKFAYYRECPNIEEYVLVNTRRRVVEVYRRTNGWQWILHPFESDDIVKFSSIDLLLPMDIIYYNVPLTKDK